MPSDIRLRLTIRRHGIPEVKLVWPCVDSDDFTIAKLLTQVNEIITLESGQWGLEDYAVELADSSGDNFECLHYQRVGAVFKNDDQVLIRSLLTDDLKRRRLSGRHQISSDGKHLVDGLAFGRPWLRTPGGRPQIELPPRKRARITYDDDDEDDEDEDEEEVPGKLLLEEAQPSRIGRNGRLFLDSNEPLVRFLDNGIDDENDRDYVPGGDASKAGFSTGDNEEDDDDGEDMVDDGEDLDEEIRLLQADNEVIEEPPSRDAIDLPAQPPRNLIQEFIRAIEAPPDPITMVALQAAFPLIPKSTIESQLKENDTDVRKTYQSLESSYDASLSYDELLDGCVTGRFEHLAKIAEKEEAAAKVPARPLIEEVEIVDTPSIAATRNPGNSKMVEDDTSDSSDSSDDTSSSEDSSSDSDSESSDSDSDEEEEPPSRHVSIASQALLSSDESSDSDSDSDSDFNSGGISLNTTNCRVTAVNEVESSSDDSSDSSSDSSDSSDDDSSDDNSVSSSEPEEVSSRPAAVSSRPRIEVVESTPLSIEPKQQADAPSSVARTEPPTVGRGQGLSKTQKRNARRKKFRELSKVEVQKDNSQDITADNLNQELLALKQALLSAVAQETTNQDNDEEMEGTDDKDDHGQREATAEETTLKPTGEQQLESPSVNPEAATSADTKDSSTTSQRRMRVDMGAGRRLLFGALGIKAPKSKADEETLKKELMKDVRPLKNHRQLENGDAPPSGQGSNPADKLDDTPPDDWKEKITYRAVECCHEGVVLSEPPFPFVQRWDPQQQYGSMRKRKRESHNFTQDESYYNEEEGSYEYPEPSGTRFGSAHKKARTSKRQEKRASKMIEANIADDIELNYDDPPVDARESSHPTELEDLPSIPDDVTNLTLLQRDKVKPGMVITWKQWLLSKATNWQPQLAPVTGVVLSVDERQVLHLRLAKRDREQEEKLYDEETGKRIYDKFEMPEDSAEEDAEDDGHREMAWNELMEPRIVQDAPSSSPDPSKEPSSIDSAANGELGADSDPKLANHEAMELDQPRIEEIQEQQDQHMTDSSLPQSGQGMVHLEFSIPSIDPPTTNSDGSRAGASQSQHGDDQTGTGMLQQVKKPLIEVVQSPPAEEASDNEEAGESGEDSDSSDSDSSFQDAEPSLDVIVASTNSDAGGDTKQSSQSESSQNSDQSSLSSSPSIHSGRQPGTELEVPDLMNQVEEGDEGEPIIPDTNQEENEVTPKAKQGSSGDESSSQSSPALPSVQEIWETALTSKQIRSPLKASQESTTRKEKTKGDGKSQLPLLNLDEGEGDGPTPRLRQSTNRNLFPNATQPSLSHSLEDSSAVIGDKPNGRSRRQRKRPASPLGRGIPRSSPGPAPETSDEDGGEDDGDDDVSKNSNEDEVKDRPARPTKGPGRLRKSRDGSKADRRKSLPLTAGLRSGKKYSPRTGGRSVSVAGRKTSRKT